MRQWGIDLARWRSGRRRVPRGVRRREICAFLAGCCPRLFDLMCGGESVENGGDGAGIMRVVRRPGEEEPPALGDLESGLRGFPCPGPLGRRPFLGLDGADLVRFASQGAPVPARGATAFWLSPERVFIQFVQSGAGEFALRSCQWAGSAADGRALADRLNAAPRATLVNLGFL